jgi:hypothetical protein
LVSPNAKKNRRKKMDSKAKARLKQQQQRTHLQLGAAGQHLVEPDTDTLNNSQQHSATDGTVPRGLVSSSYGQSSSCEETSDDGVVRVLLPPDALDGAVERREEPTPDSEVAAEYGRSRLDRCDGAYPTLAHGAVAEALDTVPYRSSDRLGREEDVSLPSANDLVVAAEIRRERDGLVFHIHP